ncbi:MAG: thiol-disulfide oxidoreductase [Candidatus Omnitrophota bacterium]|nr:MAG: thiol-disulfide oxidoreductase [Candidatus Omnitrophota bacterium]
MVKKISALFLFFVFVLSSLFAFEPLPNEPEKLIDFNLPDLDNNIISLSDFKGQNILLFFWTTWCPYCRTELKNLNDRYPEINSRGVEILAINVGEFQAKVKSFIRNYYLPFPILLDKEGDIAFSYGILGIPVFILADQQGNVLFKGHYFPEKRIQSFTQPLKSDE